MDTQTLEVLLGFTSIEVVGVTMEKSRIVLDCRSKFEEQICPSCLKKCKKIKSVSVREVRDMSLLGKEVYLRIESRQFHCEDCGRYFQERFSFVEANKTQTIRLEKYLYGYLKSGRSIQEVAVRENVLWDVLQGIFERYSQKEIKENLQYFPKRIGIDEFSYRKGKKEYAVVIVDLDRGWVWDVLEERSKVYLEAYFLSKGAVFCQGVEVVSCDMWEGFSNTAKAVFPQAEVVIDRFHFFVHCHQVLDTIRKQLRKQDPKNERFKAIKWLLYKAWKDLSIKERTTLLKAFRHAPTLRKAYFLKVELQNIFETHMDKDTAEKHIIDWIEEAKKLGHQAMDKFLNTLQTWKNDILNFFTHRVSNGIVEGINNAIKTLKRVAYGFRNFEHFRARILVKFL
jgi:transposase